ncbi:MAG: hypothetical protein PVH68_11140 [Armatimonadota bacterium]|jgi:hypothetical protein
MRELATARSVRFRWILACMTVFLLAISTAGTATAQAQWTKFDMTKADAQGRYLWHEPGNWSLGVPNESLCAEIGDDDSGRALHCVIAADAICQTMELAEHAQTEGTTLRLLRGVTLTFKAGAVLSKDRESTFYVDGTVKSSATNTSIRIGGPWGRPEADLPSACHVIISPTGILEAWFVGINTTHRANDAPSSPWGPRFFSRATDSEVIVNGGRLLAQEGLRISTVDAARPGHLRLHGKASMQMKEDARYGLQVWGGVWEIQGGHVDLRIGNVEFWGNKFRDAVNTQQDTKVGPGRAVLKLAGDGVSTIHAGKLNFIDAAFVDVGGLDVQPGRYVVIDGKSVHQTNLRLADGTDTDIWSLVVDTDKADVILRRRPGEPKPSATQSAVKTEGASEPDR